MRGLLEKIQKRKSEKKKEVKEEIIKVERKKMNGWRNDIAKDVWEKKKKDKFSTL